MELEFIGEKGCDLEVRKSGVAEVIQAGWMERLGQGEMVCWGQAWTML